MKFAKQLKLFKNSLSSQKKIFFVGKCMTIATKTLLSKDNEFFETSLVKPRARGEASTRAFYLTSFFYLFS
jgi:hypothetical protein